MKNKIGLIILLISLCAACNNGYKTAYTVPRRNTPSEYFYISNHYIEMLKMKKSHPQAVYALNKNESPILFYQESDLGYGESPNLHEGGQIVLKDNFKDTVDINGNSFKRIKIDKTIKYSLSKIIIENTFNKKEYKTKNYIIQINDGFININGIRGTIAIDVGGGYNKLKQTMITTEKPILAHYAFALYQNENRLEITPLSTDIVSEKDGDTEFSE